MRIITGRGEYVTESRCSRASSRRRGSTVQGTNKRTKTQNGVAETSSSSSSSSTTMWILGAIASSIDRLRDARRALNMHRIRNTRHTPERKTDREREGERRPSFYFPHKPRTAQVYPRARDTRHCRGRTLTRLLVGDLIEAVLKDLVQMHRLVVAGRHVFARDVKTSGRSVVEASGHGFAVRPRAEPPSSRYDHPHY